MSDSQPTPAEEFVDKMDIPGGGSVTIYPITWKLALEFKAHAAKVAASIVDGPDAIAKLCLDDAVVSILNRCCVPSLDSFPDIPLYTVAEIHARWLKLNFSGDKYRFTEALLNEMIEKLTGRPISLKMIWSNCALFMGILDPISNDANAAGPTPAGVIPNSISDLPLPPGSLVGNAQR